MNFSEKLQQTLGKAIKDASNEEIYAALLNTVKEAAADKGRNISEKGRKVYYISAEFLIGKLMSNNLSKWKRHLRDRRSRTGTVTW